MFARAPTAALAVALGCLVPYAAPFSLAPAHLPAPVAGAQGRVPSGLRAAAATRRPAGWGAAAWRPAGAGRRGGAAGVRMVNAELLQTVDEGELNKMKVAELKEVCEACGLTKTGKKADLIARILELQKATLAPEFPPAPGEGALLAGDDELEFQAAALEEGFEFQEPEEVYGMANPAPARLFDASGRSLARAELPALENGEQRFVAQPRTGNCWHGLFFDIHAKDAPITVTAIRSASSPEGSAPVREDKMNLYVYTCEGSSVGQELVPDAWHMRGSELGIQLPVVSYGESEPFYGAVPLDSPIHIKAGGTVGVCLFSSSWRGVVLRAKLGEATGWQPGEITDENSDISLHAGFLPRNDEAYLDTMFTKLFSPRMANAFVGAIEYTVG